MRRPEARGISRKPSEAKIANPAHSPHPPPENPNISMNFSAGALRYRTRALRGRAESPRELTESKNIIIPSRIRIFRENSARGFGLLCPTPYMDRPEARGISRHNAFRRFRPETRLEHNTYSCKILEVFLLDKADPNSAQKSNPINNRNVLTGSSHPSKCFTPTVERIVFPDHHVCNFYPMGTYFGCCMGRFKRWKKHWTS